MEGWLKRWGVILLLGSLAVLASGIALSSTYAQLDLTNPAEVSSFRLLAVASGVSLFAYVVGIIYSQILSNDRSRRRAFRELEKKLEAAVISLPPEGPKDGFRANIFLKKGRSKLKMVCSWNMDTWPDKGLELSIGHGCTGVAWENAEKKPPATRGLPVVASNLDEAGTWGMSPSQKELTKHIKWIVSTPILSTKAARPIGVFNCDGTIPMEDEFFTNPNLPGICASWGGIFAGLLEEYSLV